MSATVSPGLLDAVWRAHSRRVLATLIRLLGDFDAAEEALNDAFTAAADQWPRDGVPANPYAWLVSTGRFKAIDRFRRRARLDSALSGLRAVEPDMSDPHELAQPIPDDELRLIFICCHPALGADARIALTLREVGGLTTEEIARAYLVPAPTIAQRIVRAKARIRDEAIPYEVPDLAELPDRIESVLQVIYLISSEAYAATAGANLTRSDLALEAIRLGRLVVALLDDAEALGLLALMLLHEARRAARTTPQGDLVLLADQDRSVWDQTMINEAATLVSRAFAAGPVGPYALQAAIAAAHAGAPSPGQTDWSRIVALYDLLLVAHPSPVVRLNRAVAVGMRDGPAAGLAAIQAVLEEGSLRDYHLAHAAVADMHRRLGHTDKAREAYVRALGLARQDPERRFLQSRIADLS